MAAKMAAKPYYYLQVHFTADTEFIGKKEQLLSRASNKERLISAQLGNRECNVINVPGDADVDIVKTAVDSSHQHITTLMVKTQTY